MRKMTEADRAKSEFLCICLDFADRAPFDSDALGQVPNDMRVEMIRRIEYNLPEGMTAAYYEWTDDDENCKGGRVLACLMFAEQAKDGIPYAD